MMMMMMMMTVRNCESVNLMLACCNSVKVVMSLLMRASVIQCHCHLQLTVPGAVISSKLSKAAWNDYSSLHLPKGSKTKVNKDCISG